MAGIGEYKPVKIIHYVITKDGDGNNEETPTTYKTWAEVVDKAGSRSFDGGVTLDNRKSFKIRFRSNWVLNGDWRVWYFGKEYTIEKIERINEKRFNWLITSA